MMAHPETKRPIERVKTLTEQRAAAKLRAIDRAAVLRHMAVEWEELWGRGQATPMPSQLRGTADLLEELAGLIR